ncbi:MAG: terminase small subunit [Thermomicrobiales bacterium]
MADDAPQPKKLTPKQEAFVLSYIGTARFNATRAADSIGYKDAANAGHRLRRNADVRARIDEHLNTMTLTASEVLAELTDVASADWRDFLQFKYGKEGEVVDVKMDLSNKVKSLELLGKHHQLFSDNLNINGGIEIREIVGVPEDAA